MRSPKRSDWELIPVVEEPVTIDRTRDRLSALPADHDKSATQRYLRRKTLRVNVLSSPTAAQIGLDGRNQLEFRIKSLGEFGLAFMPGKADLTRSIGGIIQAVLSFGEVRLPVVCRLLYFLGDSIGAEFVGPSPLARSMIRTHFFLEFIAARLVPTVRQTETESGPCRIVTYGSEGAYGIEIFLDSVGLRAIEVRLGHLGATARWRTGEPILASLVPGVDAGDWYLRGQMVTFLKNLTGMNRRLMEAVERLLREEKIVVEYHG